MSVLVVEATVIYVLTDQLYSCLVPKVVHL